MKLLNIAVLITVSFFLFIGSGVNAEEPVNLYFFYGDGCPHCAKEEKFLDILERDHENVKIYRFETWYNQDNARLLAKIGQRMGITVGSVPMLFIGDQTITGYFNDETTGQKISDLLSDYETNGCTDVVGPIIGVGTENPECVHGCDAGDSECIHDCGCSADTITASSSVPDTVSIPFFGAVSVKNVSLPIFTLLVGAADGFNPCAMWTLLFLISLLLGMNNRRRMWILGSSFIAASGFVYFLFLAAWLNLFLFLGFVMWIRVLIGLVALGSGVWHLKSAWDNREGCPVTEDEKRKRIFTKLRALVGERNFWVALTGIILLAAAVNLVELVCSAGLPAVYTQVLALAHLPVWQYYLYLVFYIFIYMLDDLLVFIIAMSTLRMKGVGVRYTKWSGWIGGILMVLIGLLLLFKPGWLMFG